MSPLGYVGFMLGLIAIAIPLNYWSSRSRFGPSIAREQIPQHIITVVSIVVAVNLNGLTKGDQWSLIKSIIWMSCTALLWVAFVVLAIRKSKTCSILLNLGRLNKRLVWILPFFGILGSIMLCLELSLPTGSMQRAEALSFVALIWSLGIVYALMSWKETLLTEEGIRTGYTGFEWKQIENYIWSGMNKDHHYLFFKIKRRLPLANTSILDVSDELRQAVSDIVIQHTSLDVEQPTTADKQ